MLSKFITKDNFVFFSCALFSSLVCLLAFGINHVVFGIIAVMFTFIIYSAKPNNGDYIYTFVWLIFILACCYIGIHLKLSFGFYVFLLVIAAYYYVSYGKDPISDRAVPFMVIYAALGTSISGLPLESAYSFLLGGIVALIVLKIAYKNKVEFKSFKTGLFSRSLYKNNQHILLNSIIYSFFLFLSLYIPDHLGLQRVYWAPMTFIILLKPKDQNLIQNTFNRFWGSVAGAIVVFLFLHINSLPKGFNLAIIGICVFFLPSVLKLNFLLKTFGITVFILILLEFAEYWGDPNYALTYNRIFETFIGGALALTASITLKMLRKNKQKKTSLPPQ